MTTPTRDLAEAVVGEYRQPTLEEIKTIVARVRHRGFTNPMFTDTAKAFERSHPGWLTTWEYSPPDSKDQKEVMHKATLGYRLVRESELPEGYSTPHTQSGGIVRIADLVLMAAPEEIHRAIQADDARVAAEEANLPMEEYERQLAEKGSLGGKMKGMTLSEVKFQEVSGSPNLDRLSAAHEAEE